jgi:hypothetical protein
MVIAQSKLEGESSRGRRLVRRLAPMLLRGVVTVPGVTDLVSGFAIFRLVTLRNAFRGGPAPLLTTQGWAANAELFERAARHARRVETIATVERRDLRQRPSRVSTWEPALSVWRSRGSLRRLPPVDYPAESRMPRDASRQAEVAPS